MKHTTIALLFSAATAMTIADRGSAIADTVVPAPKPAIQPKESPSLAVFGTCSGPAAFSVTYPYKGAPAQLTNNVSAAPAFGGAPPAGQCPFDVLDVILPSNGKSENVALTIGPSPMPKKQAKCESYTDRFNIRAMEGPEKGRVVAEGTLKGSWVNEACTIGPNATTTVKRPERGNARYRITVDGTENGKPTSAVVSVASQG